MEFNDYLDKAARLLGGRAVLATKLGVGASALSNYVKRGDMPATKRHLLAQALLEKGYRTDAQTNSLVAIEGATGDGATDNGAINGGSADNGPKNDKPICLLIITGGIAAYKALELARRLMDEGYQIRGVMTQSAQQFITPLSLAALTAEKVYTELFSLTDEQEMGHIRLAREADLVLVAPATGNFIAKIATGLADDLATTLCLASDAPLYFAPAMNPVMWAHPATQENCAKLRHRGAQQIGPATGDTACGEIGQGRFATTADIIAALPAIGSLKYGSDPDSDSGILPLAGRHILLTAGPTREPIDGVRYISNSSSGKQGYAIASACRLAGADVTLISGPTQLSAPTGVTLISVTTAQEMYDAAHQAHEARSADCVICTAAVADWHVVGASHHKIKKQQGEGPPTLALAENPDILHALSHHEDRPDLVIGFAAETHNLIPAAIAKRRRKGCDWMMANHISPTDTVFGSDNNQLIMVTEEGETTWPATSKHHLAQMLTDSITSYFKKA